MDTKKKKKARNPQKGEITKKDDQLLILTWCLALESHIESIYIESSILHEYTYLCTFWNENINVGCQRINSEGVPPANQMLGIMEWSPT